MIQIITIMVDGSLWPGSLAVVVFEIIIPSRTIDSTYEVHHLTQGLSEKDINS